MHKQKTIHVRAGAKLIFQDDGFIIAYIDKKAQLFFQKNAAIWLHFLTKHLIYVMFCGII